MSDNIIAIVLAVFGSTGFWQIIQMWQNRHSAERDLLLGLAYDRIHHLCTSYIKRGWISVDEMADLYKYLYLPYKRMGGNGTGERLVKELDRLPKEPPKEVA